MTPGATSQPTSSKVASSDIVSNTERPGEIGAEPRNTAADSAISTATGVVADQTTATEPPVGVSTPTPSEPGTGTVVHVRSEQGLNLRRRPSTNSDIITVIPDRTKLESTAKPVTGDDGKGWYKVTYRNSTGYVAASKVDRNKPKDRASLPRDVTIPVLEYHDVGRGKGEWQVTMPDFIRQLEWLQENGYETVTLSRVYDYMYKGTDLPKKPVVFTFDDGRLSQWEAVQEMNKRGMKGVFFVMGSGTELSDERLKEIAAQGHEIGAHGMDHEDMKTVSGEDLYEEIVEARERLEKRLGVSIRFLAWPFGSYNEEAVPLLEKAGYRGAIGNGGGGTWGPLVYSDYRRWYQFRIIVDGNFTMEEFIKVVGVSTTMP